jgi:hypothetical protein
MEASGRLHATATLPPRKEPPVSNGKEVVWAPGPVQTQWQTEKLTNQPTNQPTNYPRVVTGEKNSPTVAHDVVKGD